MLNKIIGFILLIISAGLYGYWYFTPEFTADWLHWVKVAVSGISGIGVLIYEFSSLMPKFKKTKETMPPSELEQKDFEALTYLKKRMNTLGSNEGLDTLKQLNMILFSRDLDYRPESMSNE